MTKGSTPRRNLAVLAKDGVLKTKGSVPGRRLAVLAGGGRGPLVGDSASWRRLALDKMAAWPSWPARVAAPR